MKDWKKAYYVGHPYRVLVSDNGKKYVDYKSVRNDQLNMSLENSKVGPAMGFNFPVHYSCDHNCECYRLGKCYACNGCYNFMCNQALYSENLAFYRCHTDGEFIDAICEVIREHSMIKLFRWFESGDILGSRFFEDMVEIAWLNPDVRFWSYTKKYAIVNAFVDKYGLAAIPENLVIVFSHWMNEDGSYFPMENPYQFPTSEFIPVGMEHLTETVTHICPCSDPDVIAQCATCETPCYKLQHGQSMALLEHSTKASKTRDKAVREAHNALKEARKAARKGGKKA